MTDTLETFAQSNLLYPDTSIEFIRDDVRIKESRPPRKCTSCRQSIPSFALSSFSPSFLVAQSCILVDTFVVHNAPLLPKMYFALEKKIFRLFSLRGNNIHSVYAKIRLWTPPCTFISFGRQNRSLVCKCNGCRENGRFVKISKEIARPPQLLN